MRYAWKTIYWLMVWVWLIVTIHIWYLYVRYSSSESTWSEKKWTFVEATTSEAGYLPYLSSDDADKFYQSLLFRGCVFPVLNETDISYTDDLCVVTTQDYQTFDIELSASAGDWSDGVSVNLNDILFTYQTLLSDNYRQIPAIESFAGITVDPDIESNRIQVIFGQASVDNMIFFTNFILPSHILANQPLAMYAELFANSPISSSCGTLQPAPNDQTSTVFDLSWCAETNIRYYQVKAFSEVSDIEEYIPTSSLTIDMSIDQLQIEWYTDHPILANKLQAFFFNTKSESFAPSKRKKVGDAFASIFAATDTQDYLIKDPYLFDQYEITNLSETWAISKLRKGIVTQAASTSPTEQILELAALPTTLARDTDNRSQEYQVSTRIQDKYQMIRTFPETFDRLSVIHNTGAEYFPASYSAITQSSLYNLNPLFNNIIAGINTYTIRGYRADESVVTYTLIVEYLNTTNSAIVVDEAVVEQDTSITPLRVISFSDTTSIQIIEDLQQSLVVFGMSDLFEFEMYDERSEYEGKLTSRDYDIVLRTINLWLRKDLSALFTQDDPLVNPSLWNDQEFADQMNRYFRATPDQKAAIKSFVDERFAEQYPLVMIGKAVETVTIREDIDNPFPLRMYVMGWRKQYLPNIQVFNHISIDRDRVKSVENFATFVSTAVRDVASTKGVPTQQ